MSAHEKNAFPPARNSFQAPEEEDAEENPLVLQWATPDDEHVHCFRQSPVEDAPKIGVHECQNGYLFPATSSTHGQANYYGRLILPDYKCDDCGDYVENIARPEVKEQHQKECRNIIIAKIDKIKESMTLECPICQEVIKDKPGRLREFGILSNCDHVFCFDCVIKWFNETNEPENKEKNQHKGCPLCRRVPQLISRCYWWIKDKAEKKERFTSYATTLKIIFDRSCKACNRTDGLILQRWVEALQKLYPSDVGT